MRVFSTRLISTSTLLILWLLFSISWGAEPESFTVTGDVDLFVSPNGSQIAKLIAGKESKFTFMTEVQSEGKEWVKIPLEGWIKKTSITQKLVDSKNIKVIKKDNLLAAPNKSVLAIISEGTEIEVLEITKSWVKIRLLGWLPTSQTNLPLLRQSQPETIASNHPLPESSQNNAAGIDNTEKMRAIEEQKSASTIKLIKELEEKLILLSNLDFQIKNQNEQQLLNMQLILEQLKNIEDKFKNKTKLTIDTSITPYSVYFTPMIGVSILCAILVMGLILWWLLYNRLNKLSGFSQFSEINERLVRSTDAIQSLNTLTIKGFEENKGVVSLLMERNSNELRENLIKQLVGMTQEMNLFFTQSSQSRIRDFSDFRESVFKQLIDNKNDINDLFTTNNKNQQISFSEFSDKAVILLMNSSKTTNESLQNLAKEIKDSFSNLNEKVITDLGSIQTNLASSLGTLNQSLGHSFSDFNEKIIGTLTEMSQLVANSINILKEKILNELGGMRTQLVSSTAESVQSQTKAMEEFRDKVGLAVESSLKNSTDMLNSMFTELRNTTQNHLQSMNEKVEDRLNKGFEKNNEIFLNVVGRLQQIDQAQQRISELSNNVISLQKTLDSKGARGAFGEIQLVEIVRDLFPEKYIKFQPILSNGKRPDCLLLLPPPTGDIAIDAKFPLENYLIMVNKETNDQDRKNASNNFKRDIRKHINDIYSKYIILGETANGAVMFIPSEAIFAEIHAYHPDLVQEAQNRRIWITSPTTLMAILTTARAVLADAERNKQARIIHDHLIALSTEFGRFTKRISPFKVS